MPRYSVSVRTGLVVATGLYELPHAELVAYEDEHAMVPAGCFLLDGARWSAWTNRECGSLFLCHDDLVELPRGEYCGCCGPDGSHANILDPGTMAPIAYESADCYVPRYVRIDRGEYVLREESGGDPVCLVAFVEYRGAKCLIGAACGRDEEEANARLMPLARRQLEWETHFENSSYEPVRSPLLTEDARIFLERLGGESPRWLFRKY